MAEHTKTPWMVYENNDGKGNRRYEIRTVKPHNPGANEGRGGVGIHIGITNEALEAKGEANAAHIVTCVNAHEALIKACKAMVSCTGDGSASMQTAREYARAALALVEGK